MKLGIGSYAFAWGIGVPEYPLPDRPMTGLDLVERAVDLDVKVVQIADNMPLDQMDASELDALQACADAANVAIEVGTRGIRPGHLRTYLDLAVRFNSPLIRVVVDTADHHPDADEVVALAREVMPDFQQAGVCLAIENHDRFPVRMLDDICERIGSDQVGICLDTVNSFGSLEGPEAVVDVLGPRVVNLHVKEFLVRRVDHNMGFIIEGQPAGQGMLNMPWLLEKLGQHGRDYNAIVELWPPLEKTMAETVAKEAEWAAQSVVYLRTLISD